MKIIRSDSKPAKAIFACLTLFGDAVETSLAAWGIAVLNGPACFPYLAILLIGACEGQVYYRGITDGYSHIFSVDKLRRYVIDDEIKKILADSPNNDFLKEYQELLRRDYCYQLNVVKLKNKLKKTSFFSDDRDSIHRDILKAEENKKHVYRLLKAMQDEIVSDLLFGKSSEHVSFISGIKKQEIKARLIKTKSRHRLLQVVSLFALVGYTYLSCVQLPAMFTIFKLLVVAAFFAANPWALILISFFAAVAMIGLAYRPALNCIYFESITEKYYQAKAIFLKNIGMDENQLSIKNVAFGLFCHVIKMILFPLLLSEYIFCHLFRVENRYRDEVKASLINSFDAYFRTIIFLLALSLTFGVVAISLFAIFCSVGTNIRILNLSAGLAGKLWAKIILIAGITSTDTLFNVINSVDSIIYLTNMENIKKKFRAVISEISCSFKKPDNIYFIEFYNPFRIIRSILSKVLYVGFFVGHLFCEGTSVDRARGIPHLTEASIATVNAATTDLPSYFDNESAEAEDPKPYLKAKGLGDENDTFDFLAAVTHLITMPLLLAEKVSDFFIAKPLILIYQYWNNEALNNKRDTETPDEDIKNKNDSESDVKLTVSLGIFKNKMDTKPQGFISSLFVNNHAYTKRNNDKYESCTMALTA